MKYRLYLLDFYNGVHFGKGNLDSTELTFHADTFFSALFQEALKLEGKKSSFWNLRMEELFSRMRSHIWVRPITYQNLWYRQM